MQNAGTVVEVLRARGRRRQPAWAALMAKMRRKTLLVCPDCHQAIHDGKPAASRTSASLESRMR
jgi:hypothetical protein